MKIFTEPYKIYDTIIVITAPISSDTLLNSIKPNGKNGTAINVNTTLITAIIIAMKMLPVQLICVQCKRFSVFNVVTPSYKVNN